jgi:hypothetical protein
MHRRTRSGADRGDSASNSADQRLDNTSLQEYLEQIGASDVFIKAIQSVFGGEYGQEIHLQSCLNFILFAKLTRSKSRIVYFGANNAERYAIAEGCEALAQGLRDDLLAAGGVVRGGMSLTALRKTTDGRYVLTFAAGMTSTHDAVVLAIPATVIRERVALDTNLGIAPETRDASFGLQYGDNTKTMFQFDSNRGRLLQTVDPDGMGFLHGYDDVFLGQRLPPYHCSMVSSCVRAQRVGELHLQPARLLHDDGGLARRAGREPRVRGRAHRQLS